MKRKRAVAAGVLLLATAALLAVRIAWLRRGPPPAAQGGPHLTTPMERWPFRPGEKAVFELSVGNLPAATCTVRTRMAELNGRPCLEVAYDVRSSEIVNAFRKFTLTGRTLMDPRTLQPLWVEKVSLKPDKEKRTFIEFDRQAKVAHIRKVKKKEGRETRDKEDVPFETGMDVLATLMRLRVNAGGSSEPVSLRVMKGDEFYEMVVEPAPTEPQTVGAGTFDALCLTIKSRELADEPGESPGPWRTTRLWLSRDSRVPLKFDASFLLTSAVAELTSYQEGGEPWPAGQ